MVKILLTGFLILKFQSLIGRSENKYGLLTELISDDFEGLEIHNQGFLWFATIESLVTAVPSFEDIRKYVNMDAQFIK